MARQSASARRRRKSRHAYSAPLYLVWISFGDASFLGLPLKPSRERNVKWKATPLRAELISFHFPEIRGRAASLLSRRRIGNSEGPRARRQSANFFVKIIAEAFAVPRRETSDETIVQTLPGNGRTTDGSLSKLSGVSRSRSRVAARKVKRRCSRREGERG